MENDKGLPVPTVVLDSQVVFDWLVFRRPSVQPLVDALTRGQVQWLASAALRDEMAHVLGRGVLARYAPDEAALWAAWARWAQLRSPAAPTGTACRLRCRDPDDQKFVDLALTEGAQWLLSRDRAVLALARRARPLGLRIGTPEAWALQQPPAADSAASGHWPLPPLDSH